MDVELIRYLPVDENSGLGVPYKSKQGSYALVTYFDLKRNPEVIPTVTELKDYPALQIFVKELNKPTSIFRTLRCDPRCTCKPATMSVWQTHWFFTFAFEIVEQNHFENFEAFNKILDSRINSKRSHHKIAFDIRKVNTSYRDHGITLFSEDIEMFGFGKTKIESANEFLFGLRLLQSIFATESSNWFGQLGSERKTIS